MSNDAYTTWSERSLDAAPDFSLLVAVGSGDVITPGLDVVAAHLATRSLTWELIVVALDVDVVSPHACDLANAFFIGRRQRDERLGPLRRGTVDASGHRVLLTGAELAVALVHLDETIARLDEGTDIVLGWPYPEAVASVQPDLPRFMGCASGVARALGDTRSVYGGSRFADAMQAAHFWGLEVDELHVDVAVADKAHGRGSIRPAGRVCVGPVGSPIR